MSKSAKGILEASLKEEAERKERLRQALPAAVELLRTRQAGLIAAREIEEFVALNWLEWHGGTLRLTVTGSNVVLARPSKFDPGSRNVSRTRRPPGRHAPK
jgi:hypothetical protein